MLPHSLRDWFAHFGALRTKHLEIDILAPRCFFRKYNEFLFCGAYQLALMISLAEGAPLKNFLFTDQIEDEIADIGDDFSAGLQRLGRELAGLWADGTR